MADGAGRPLIRSFRDAPIRSKLLLLSLLTSAVGLLPAATALIIYVWSSTQASSARDLDTLARITADGVGAALTFNDTTTARETLAALRAKPEIDRACLYANPAANRLFASYQTSATEACPGAAGAPGTHEDFRHLVSVVPVRLAGETIGGLLISQDLDTRQRAIAVQAAVVLAILGAAFVASFALGLRLQRGLSEPVLDLADTARRVSSSGDYSLRAERRGGDEIGALVDDFNRMLGQIASRDRDLQQARDALTIEVQEKSHANTDLESAMLKLRETQAQLVQSEKMASLGSLVAGIAHEINTPIGVGVTAASTLQEWAQRLQKQHVEGKLTR
ncbi:MAG TPA: CHASE sensor domain-containing protein, partial [Solimonas sp.]|nr:CHASE sensor domain-containing protein [Solimonas sp.]